MAYTKFVIISHLRSGTHLLRSLLESHPQLVCQSEVFNSDDPALPFSLDMPSRDILDQWVYRDFASSISCAGFVLQVYHPWGLRAFPGIRENPGWGDIWALLEAMPDLHVIHLQRENLLRRHLSHLLARKTGNWHNWVPEKAAAITHLHPLPVAVENIAGRPAVTLDAERLQIDFEEVEALHQEVATRFAGGRYMTLTYEQLSGESDTQSARLLDFLELPPARLEAAVSRLDSRPLCESIRNFEALREEFADTRWSAFFQS